MVPLLLLLLACVRPPAPPELVAPAEAPLPTAAQLRPRPEGGWPRLSDDGQQVAVVQDWGGHPALHLGPADGSVAPTPTRAMPRGLAWWGLSADARQVAWIDRAGGVAVSSVDGSERRLARLERRPRWVVAQWGAERLVAAVPHEGDGLRVVTVSLADGAVAEVWSDPHAGDVVLDAALRPRLLFDREEARHGRGLTFDRIQARTPRGWEPGPPLLQGAWVVDRMPAPHVGDGPISLLAGDDRVRRCTLTATAVACDPQGAADAVRWTVDPTSGAVDAVAQDVERLRWAGAADTVADLAWLANRLEAQVFPTHRTPDDRRWVVAAEAGDRPTQAWVFDRDTRALWRHGPRYGPLEQAALRPSEPLLLKARDGWMLPAWLTRPSPERFGPGPHPLILAVHGGPWSGRHSWRLSPTTQAWAARGYATLTVNFRGSRGYGWQSTRAATFGGRMIQDLEDALDHAIQIGAADPDRVAVVGGSFGGYAALRLATDPRAPTRCAVSSFGRSDLIREGGGLNVAAVKTPAWRRRHSPTEHVDSLHAAVLLVTGSEDGGTEHSAFVAGAEARGAQPIWVEFPGEGHGLRGSENRQARARIEDRFLAACLGGPALPWGQALDGATLTVRAGAGVLDGLPPAAPAAADGSPRAR